MNHKTPPDIQQPGRDPRCRCSAKAIAGWGNPDTHLSACPLYASDQVKVAPRAQAAEAILGAAAKHIVHEDVGAALMQLGAGVLAGDGMSDAEVMRVAECALRGLHGEHPNRRPAAKGDAN